MSRGRVLTRISQLVWPAFYVRALREVVALLTRHRQLTWEMTRHDIADRYVGHVFGVLWAIGHPLFLIAVYLFVFVVVFRVKIGGTVEMPLDYSTYLLCGLIPWLSFNESMGKSTTVIVSHANLIKQVVFPIEILPVKGVLASFLNQLITTSLLILYVLAMHRGLFWTYLLIPLLFGLQIAAMIGVSYILSSIGVYFRDLKDFVQLFGIAGVFVMPIFYLPDQVPQAFRPILYLNPFSYMAWCYQDVFYFGRIEHPWAWLVFVLFSVGSLVIGYRVFRKLKPTFGNVL